MQVCVHMNETMFLEFIPNFYLILYNFLLVQHISFDWQKEERIVGVSIQTEMKKIYHWKPYVNWPVRTTNVQR